MGENHFAEAPVAIYGVVLFCSGIAYFILSRTLIAHHGKDSTLATAVGSDFKSTISLVIYVIAISLSLVRAWMGWTLYIIVAVMWFIPDRRIEKEIVKEAG